MAPPGRLPESPTAEASKEYDRRTRRTENGAHRLEGRGQQAFGIWHPGRLQSGNLQVERLNLQYLEPQNAVGCKQEVSW